MPEGEDIGKLAQRVLREAEGTPEREAWLEQLREEIRSGRYHVDSETLADSLIRRLFQSPEAPTEE